MNVMKPEEPCLSVFNACRQFNRAVPVLAAPKSMWMMWTRRPRILWRRLGFGLLDRRRVFRSRSVRRFPRGTPGCCQVLET